MTERGGGEARRIINDIRSAMWSFFRHVSRWVNPLTTMLLIVGAVLIAGVIAYLSLRLSSTQIEGYTFRYSTGIKVEYTDGIRLNRSREGEVTLTGGRDPEELESSPLYIGGEGRILLPQQVMAVVPDGGIMGRLEYYDEISFDGEKAVLKRPNPVELTEGFLFDGADTYVFLDHTTVVWGDKRIEVTPLSYAIVIYNQRIELYPAGGEPLLEYTNGLDVTAECQSGYSIDLGKDVFKGADSDMLLFSKPELLAKVE